MAAFDLRDVRRGMDVYDRDGRWLGTVLNVDGENMALPRRRTTYPSSRESFNGELIGPASTQTIGNWGPINQAAYRGYASSREDASQVDRFQIGRWQGLAGRRWLPVEAIVNVTLERIVVDPGYANRSLDRLRV